MNPIRRLLYAEIVVAPGAALALFFGVIFLITNSISDAATATAIAGGMAGLFYAMGHLAARAAELEDERRWPK